MSDLKVTAISYEGAILDAIKEAHIANRKVVKLGLTQSAMKEILGYFSSVSTTKKSKIKSLLPNQVGSLFGIPVEITKTLQITTEFSRLRKELDAS